MKFTAIVEIPRGSDRRIHMAYDNSGFIDLGPISEHISINKGVMPVCYGYIDSYINKSEGDNVDCIIFSKNDDKTGDAVEVEVIGIMMREDTDHKVICIDNTSIIENFEALEESESALIVQYFGFKSKIVSVGSREKAVEYLNSCIL